MFTFIFALALNGGLFGQHLLKTKKSNKKAAEAANDEKKDDKEKKGKTKEPGEVEEHLRKMAEVKAAEQSGNNDHKVLQSYLLDDKNMGQTILPMGPVGAEAQVRLGRRIFVVSKVVSGGCADKAGLKVGDTIISANGKTFEPYDNNPHSGGKGAPRGVGEAIEQTEADPALNHILTFVVLREVNMTLDEWKAKRNAEIDAMPSKANWDRKAKKLAKIRYKKQLASLKAAGVNNDAAQRIDIEMTIKIKLPDVGGLSKTYPYNCGKSEWFYNGVIEFIANNRSGGGTTAALSHLALLGTGDQKYLPQIKSYVYDRCSGFQEDAGGLSNWAYMYNGIVVAEYFLRYRDKNVLEFLQKTADLFAKRTDPNGRHGHGQLVNGLGGYGGAGLNMVSTGIMWYWATARKCGIKIDEEAWNRTMAWMRRSTAGNGGVGYIGADGGYESTGRTGNMALAAYLFNNKNSIRQNHNHMLAKLTDGKAPEVKYFEQANNMHLAIAVKQEQGSD